MPCTIVQRNWSRGDECSAAFSRVVNEREGRFMHWTFAGMDRTKTPANTLPFDSQSAQYLFSSSASRELSTAWYLSTSFTDLPVIIAPVHLLQSPPPQSPTVETASDFSQTKAVCVAEPMRPGALAPRRKAGRVLFHNDGMVASQPTSVPAVRDANTPNRDVAWRQKTPCDC